MGLNYLVSDTFSRIQNGLTAKLTFVYVLNSEYIQQILDFLAEEGYIVGYCFLDTELLVRKHIKVFLKYDKFGNPAINNLKLISLPGLRHYAPVTKLKLWRKRAGGMRVSYLLSTPKGLLSDAEAIRENIGGELICRVT